MLLTAILPTAPFFRNVTHATGEDVCIQSVTETSRKNFSHEFHIPKHYKCPYQHVSGNIYFVSYSRKNTVVTYSIVINFFGDYLVGSPVLPHRLTGNHHRDFLSHDLPKVLEDVSLAIRPWMWCMHGGAPAHFSRAVRDVLNSIYHERWLVEEASTLARFESSGFLPVVTPEYLCVCGSCWQRKGTSPLHCECLSDCQNLSRHLGTDTVVQGETCRGVRWISWRTFWAHINVLFQL
jgi:hypothetical protein